MTHSLFLSRKALLLTSAAASLAIGSAAHAAETVPATALAEGAVDAAGTAEADTGNTIVVTGVRRRDEDVQTIPVAISVIDAGTIEDAGINQLGDFQQLVPSLKVVSFNPRNTNINIRGLGANIALTNDGLDPGVGFYIDDVFYARPGHGP
ncbi:TonB-dependent receptor plug domain-containing protein [Porphyrobacter sp. AAP82]|uniref:TonB-dependent receptor plug domain-containing protein n=1 Tax=Porphyrobacter sp. AAP82 TaxID=1248917 RepID=UPI00030086A2|nr:Plug domain-containing protein [Porphyrobacter sp. AAP82]